MSNKLLKKLQIAIGILTILVSIDGIAHAMVVDEVKGQAAEQGPIMEQEVYVAEGKTGMVMKKTQGDKKAPQYAPGEIIIKLKEKVSEDTLYGQRYSTRIAGNTSILSDLKTKYNLKDPRPVSKALHEQLKSKNISMRQLRGAKAKPGPDLFPIYILKTDQEPLAISNRLKNDPNIEYAEPNYQVEVQMVPNDPYYSSSGSWGQPYDDLWGIKKIQCEQAWDISQGDGVVVAVIDTGVDYNHPDLWDNIWVNPAVISDRNSDGKIDLNDCDLNSDHFIEQNEIVDNMFGWDFDNNDNNPMDGYGHGTHCAGTVAAVGNNSIGVIGVAPHAKIMILKGLGDAGSGTAVNLAQCVTYAADHGAHITSNSWGGGGISQIVIDAFHYAYSTGCVCIAAAGNNNSDVSGFSPANIDTVIAVAASTQNDEKCKFSNYGAKIDIAAPGGGYSNELGGGPDDKYNILSTMPDSSVLAQLKPNLKIANGYWRLAGTSMACPHVAGVAALLLSQHPEYSVEQIEAIIKTATIDDITSSEYIGKGVVNAFEALNMVSPPDATACITNPLYGDICGPGVLSITGGATGVEYSVSYSNGGPYSNNWILIGSGGHIENGELAIFDPVGLPLGCYFIKLTVIDSHGYEIIGMTKVYIDPTLLPGWPKEIASKQIVSSPICADFDNDGNKELFAIDFYGKAYMWNVSGDILPGWPREFPHYYPIHVYSSPAVMDVDQDGDLEIILVSSGESRILIWRHDGTIFKKIVIPGDSYTFIDGSPAIGDINGDNRPEIIIVATNLRDRTYVKVFAFDLDGHLLAGWPYVISGLVKEATWNATVALADFDNDRKKEMVVTCSDIGESEQIDDYKVYVYILKGDGSLLSGWPQVRNSGGVSQPSLGDVNNDGKLEIFFGNNGFPETIFGLDSQGNNLAGWPHYLYTGINSGIALADLDEDGDLEIAFQEFNSKVYVYHHDGSIAVGWPQQIPGNVYVIGPSFYSSVVIGDIDGDNSDDLIVGSAGTSELYAFNRTGEVLPSFPKKVGNDGFPQILSTPSIVDFNGDGKAEIIVGGRNGRVYVWGGMPAPTNFEIMEWPMFHHDVLHTGRYNKPPELDHIGNKTINEGQALEFLVTAYDPDGDTLTFLASNLPEGVSFDPQTGTVTWTPTYEQAGTYNNIHFEVTDRALTDSEDITITVKNVNRPPVLAPIGNKKVNENEMLRFIVSATDPDGDKLRYYASPLPIGARFNTSTGEFIWTPTYEQAGRYNVNFLVSDGQSSDRESIDIVVINVDRLPVLNPIGNKRIAKGKTLTFHVSATDADGDKLYFGVDNLPRGATFEPVRMPNTYKFSWTPGEDQTGKYNVTFWVMDLPLHQGGSDNSHKDSETITITVTDVSNPSGK